jgi:hypothetical protein
VRTSFTSAMAARSVIIALTWGRVADLCFFAIKCIYVTEK